LTLPDGVSLVDEQDIPNIDNHRFIDVVVRLCNQFQDASLDPACDPGAVKDVWKYADQMY
jgi:hypothetical protein